LTKSVQILDINTVIDMAREKENPFKSSALYSEFLAEREEILRHKWIESEKAGRDIGFEKALLDWIVKHRPAWRKTRSTALMLEQHHPTAPI
jgi:hypothetical protein